MFKSSLSHKSFVFAAINESYADINTPYAGINISIACSAMSWFHEVKLCYRIPLSVFEKEMSFISNNLIFVEHYSIAVPRIV